ncbi:MAG TPA: hypothetical protein VEZ72_13515, partial [Paenibacillus sp.]|nr:hypothetical protein [Paenibacillus sp.]
VSTFDAEHEAWYAAARRGRTRRAKEELASGHGPDQRLFLRNVWWPAFGTFEHLHPQYEVPGEEGAAYRLDFAYLRPPFRVAIQVDEGRLVGRRAPTERLAADFWIVLRFGLDAIARDPSGCRRSLTDTIDRLYRERASGAERLTPSEKETVRLAARSLRPTTPTDVMRALQVSDKTARALLKSLVDKRLLRPAGAGLKRIRAYEPAVEPLLLLQLVG